MMKLLPTPMVALVLFVGLTSAFNNYDNYIREVERRSQMVHDSFMEMPGVRDHLYDTLAHIHSGDTGEVNALHESSSDEDIANYWNELLQKIETVRQQKNDELQEHMAKWSDSENEGEEDNRELQEVIKSDEVPYKNHLWGEHRVSGGTGKEDASLSGVKTDMLPGYCDPPNPCPVGVDPSKLTAPCDENIPNTKAFNKEWIWKKMKNGECQCDVDHMEVCPRENVKKSDGEDLSSMLSNAVVKSALVNHAEKKGVNPYLKSKAHITVSKKAGPVW